MLHFIRHNFTVNYKLQIAFVEIFELACALSNLLFPDVLEKSVAPRNYITLTQYLCRVLFKLISLISLHYIPVYNHRY